HKDGDDQWLYLPELRKTKRIAGSSRALSFAGTDFSNFDMRTEDLARHDYKRLDDGTAGGRACYVVEATPKNDDVKEETGYSRRTISIDKERWTVLQCVYYDKDGKLLKTLTTEGETQVDGLWRPVRVTMANVQEGTKTVVLHDRGREINKGIDDEKFTKRALERS
ncbi:MAG: outer membrane lipoprotein-sorting protein, partial [Polyangiaceae bacterium]